MNIGIIGAGIFGLYTALELNKAGHEITIYEQKNDAFTGASFVNQARVHRGYHYPRSSETAMQCIKNYKRFEDEFDFAINKEFDKYYCISSNDSKVSKSEYLRFLNLHNLSYEVVENNQLEFDILNVDLILRVPEYSFDANRIKKYLLNELKIRNISVLYNHRVTNGNLDKNYKTIYFHNLVGENSNNHEVVINASYSNVNGINQMFKVAKLPLAFELCEMIQVKTPGLENVGITIMDGDFTSIMPFGFSGYSTISNVRRTPHERSDYELPIFSCNKNAENCKSYNTDICLECNLRPSTSFLKMRDFACKFIPALSNMEIVKSMIAVKTIFNNVESTDSRLTKVFFDQNIDGYITILSGKVDTVFEVSEAVLKYLAKKYD